MISTIMGFLQFSLSFSECKCTLNMINLIVWLTESLLNRSFHNNRVLNNENRVHAKKSTNNKRSTKYWESTPQLLFSTQNEYRWHLPSFGMFCHWLIEYINEQKQNSKSDKFYCRLLPLPYHGTISTFPKRRPDAHLHQSFVSRFSSVLLVCF